MRDNNKNAQPAQASSKMHARPGLLAAAATGALIKLKMLAQIHMMHAVALHLPTTCCAQRITTLTV
jgi:hypothetical protein